ncbi:uncharacterized protein LOC144152518 [Haemaphysalis longicornis]
MPHIIAVAMLGFLLTAVAVKSEYPGASVKGQQNLPNSIEDTGRQDTTGLPSTQGTGNVYVTQPSLTPRSDSTPSLGSPDPLQQLLMDHQKKRDELVQSYTEQMTQLQTKLDQELQKLSEDLKAAMTLLWVEGK